jgi:hypothetical protein
MGCNFNITGKLKIVEIPGSSENKNIAFSTKQALVNKFGNIDSTDNKLFVEYQKTTVTSTSISGPAEVSVFGTFNTPINGLFPVTITSGNNVEILNEENPYNPAVTGRLNISYACAKISGNDAYSTIIKDFNTKTGAITINKESETFTAKVTITVNGKYTREIIVKFAWKAPGVGDFAYVDGTFSSGYDPNKTLAGLVYATKADSDTEGTAYIIGAEYTSDTPYYLGYSQENISQGTDVNKVVFDTLNNYLDTKGIKNYDNVVFNPSQTIDNSALIAVTGSYYNNYQEGYDIRDLSHF